MATDDDAPRTRSADEPANESLEAIQAQRSATTQTAVIDTQHFDTAEGIDLPDADLSHEELTIQVVPEQIDEFTCGSWFLVHHRSPLARATAGSRWCCTDCEDWTLQASDGQKRFMFRPMMRRGPEPLPAHLASEVAGGSADAVTTRG